MSGIMGKLEFCICENKRADQICNKCTADLHLCFRFTDKTFFLLNLELNPGASCSKLTTSLVNVSLKFQTLILQIHCHFLLKKCENPLHCKGFSHFFKKKITVYLLL